MKKGIVVLLLLGVASVALAQTKQEYKVKLNNFKTPATLVQYEGGKKLISKTPKTYVPNQNDVESLILALISVDSASDLNKFDYKNREIESQELLDELAKLKRDSLYLIIFDVLYFTNDNGVEYCVAKVAYNYGNGKLFCRHERFSKIEGKWFHKILHNEMNFYYEYVIWTQSQEVVKDVFVDLKSDIPLVQDWLNKTITKEGSVDFKAYFDLINQELDNRNQEVRQVLHKCIVQTFDKDKKTK